MNAEAPRLDFLEVAKELLPEGASYDACVGCGLCASGCPASGLFGMDPRRFINMAMLGMNEELSTTPWVWACTQCKRCAYVCPMGIDVSLLVGAGAQRPGRRRTSPRASCAPARPSRCLTRAPARWGCGRRISSRSSRRPSRKCAKTEPRFADLKVPIDKKGAKFVVNQNSREPAVEPEEMAPMWKIFDYVGADWTYASKGWAAENFCMFTGDDEAWKDDGQDPGRRDQRAGPRGLDQHRMRPFVLHALERRRAVRAGGQFRARQPGQPIMPSGSARANCRSTPTGTPRTSNSPCRTPAS